MNKRQRKKRKNKDWTKVDISIQECVGIDLRLIPTPHSMLNRFDDEELKMSYKEFVEHRFKQCREEMENE